MNASYRHPEVEKVAELLRIGRTADEVAKALEKRAIRGYRHTASSLNPIVRLVWQQLPEACEIDVTPENTMRITFPQEQEERVPLPQPVRAFLGAFDRGDYPKLEVTPEE
jgi:hypothetical protein